MAKTKRTIMNVEVASSVREAFNRICDKRGLKKSYVMTHIILDFIKREEERDGTRQRIDNPVGQAGGGSRPADSNDEPHCGTGGDDGAGDTEKAE